ncbi:DNA-binding HxlR family transcriptional regulator [Azospirillum fermentarium]|uniref:winged helix-turn-helix transcriptional regulator n=1 Tax=Azospirillum fermentarium TaxID=1233114 RepID=UPI0022261150|nr:helix-turn-helix domain-containing protein [Azospirillum fermentarium]MCW2246090.1 DNA-binding HxlR family transcriptional regulator [Azospirillum fermentarium]
MKKRRYECAPGCPVEATLDLIDGKWKGIILFHLLDGTLRFNELMRRLNAVTQRMLTKQLRELEEAGLILRTVYPQVPPKVEYSLTPEGESLRPVLMALYAWGVERMARLNQTERPMPGTPGAGPACVESAQTLAAE